jgi:TatA/E family protein of Tat protein translocase
MGIESPVHLLFIAIVALIVLGPKRLPGLARALGQGIREFRSSLDAGAQPPEPAAPPVQRPPAPPAQQEQQPAARPAQHQQRPAAPPPEPQQAPPPAARPAATTATSPLAEVAERASGQSNGAERPHDSA